MIFRHVNHSRHRRILVIICCLAGLASFGITRSAEPDHWHPLHESMRRWLGVSRQQAESMKQADSGFDQQVGTRVAKLIQAQDRLIQLLDNPASSAAAILEQVEAVIERHNALSQRIFAHILTIRQYLTAEQKARLMDLCQKVVRGQGIGRGRKKGWGPHNRQHMRHGGQGQRQGVCSRCLQLSPDQVQAMEQLDPLFQRESRQLGAALLAAHENLAVLLEDISTSDAVIEGQLQKLMTAQGNLERRVARHITLVRPHLRPDQTKRLIGLCARYGKITGPAGPTQGKAE